MGVGQKDRRAFQEVVQPVKWWLQVLGEVDGFFGFPKRSNQGNLIWDVFRRLGVRAVAKDKPIAFLDFIADEFGQARVVRFQALEEKQDRIVPAPFEFVADLANLLQIAVRVGDEDPRALVLFC